MVEKEDYQLVTTHAKFADRMYFGGKQRERYFRERDFIDRIIKKHGLGKKIIDAGCGTGVHIALLAELGYDVIAFDIRQEMIDVAVQRNPKARIVRGDMRDFPLKERADTIICMFGAINYIETEESIIRTLKNFFNHLEDRGAVIIDTRYHKNLPSEIESWTNPKYILVKRWIKEGGMQSSYRIFYTVPSHGVMVLEDHKQYFQDPFWLEQKLKGSGFSKVDIFDNYNISQHFTEYTNSYKPVVVGLKVN